MVNELTQDVAFVGSSAPVTPTLITIRSAAGLAFKASHIFIANDGGATVRCALTTSLSTSLGIQLTTGSNLFFQGLQSGCESVALLTTSSSTSGFLIRLGAWS